MSRIQFSWNNQRGYGLALLFFGWALLIQIPSFYHNYLLIKVPISQNDWMVFAGTIIFITVLLGAFLGSIFENLFDPFNQTFINTHTVVLIAFIVFYFFYLASVPFIEMIEPFLGLPRKIDIFGWGEYLLCVFSGIIGMSIFWYLSEYRIKISRSS